MVLFGLPLVALAVAPCAALPGFAGVLLAAAVRGVAEVMVWPLGLPGWVGVPAVVLAALGLGAFLAATPGSYFSGLRDRAGSVLRDLGRALRARTGALLIAMGIVGGLTVLGLTLLGMPLAGILAVVAALLGFVPILGPIIGAVPMLLLAFGYGWSLVVWAAGLCTIVQVIEGDLVMPLLQSRAIRLPPGLILAAQPVMLTPIGPLGLALPAPLAAVLLGLGWWLYANVYLLEGRSPTGEGGA